MSRITTRPNLRLGGPAVLAVALAVTSCHSSSTPPPEQASTPATPVAAPAISSKYSYLPADVAARKVAAQPYTAPPTAGKNLYPPPEAAPGDIKAALAKAKAEHKRVILDFGGSWCGDCQVLDIYFHQAPNADLLAKNFVKVNVNIGQEDANLDLAHGYGVPVQGVPALAVLDANGKVLYAQNKEFSDMRYMEPSYVTDFLNKWKPGA